MHSKKLTKQRNCRIFGKNTEIYVEQSKITNRNFTHLSIFAGESSTSDSESSSSSTSSDSDAGTGDAAEPVDEIPDEGPISLWFKMTRARHTPYSPQLGDDLVYFYQGHSLYLNQVKDRKLYPVEVERDAPWMKHSFIKVGKLEVVLKFSLEIASCVEIFFKLEVLSAFLKKRAKIFHLTFQPDHIFSS